MMIAHPPCTYLASSGLHWNKKRPTTLKTEAALSYNNFVEGAHQKGSFGKSCGLHQHTTQVYAEASMSIPICLE